LPGRRLLADPTPSQAPPKKDNLFPDDLFTPDQLRKGAITLHMLGMIYMFVALAIVCDEFFVPSLDVITEKLNISNDVAGATFMAAGGSAPELFTSIIGVFIAKNDVGIGTIVGSAVFNILFVIAMCVIFSRTVLELTWWPLFRDVSFYSVALILLMVSLEDAAVQWWEALILFGWYLVYCVFMKFNAGVERWVKTHIVGKRVSRVRSTDHLVSNLQPGSQQGLPRRPSTPIIHSGSKFRQGLLQLMIHSIDPMHNGKVDEKATQLHAIASLKVLLDTTKQDLKEGKMQVSDIEGARPDLLSGRGSQETELTNVDSLNSSTEFGSASVNAITTANGSVTPAVQTPNEPPTLEDEDAQKPIDLSWPDTTRKRIIYVLVAPIVFLLWITLPDCKSPRGRRFFFIAFLGSIIWIAIFSYMMVWWAITVADVMEIPPEVVGLTVLAAGTSVPDLITSVIVARKGFGDMAVSSSVGSNIFDICVGLPVPWMLDALAKTIGQLSRQETVNVLPTKVDSEGMNCNILCLFIMLMFVIISIACFRWRMHKGLGVVMFLLYFIFLAVALSFEFDQLVCDI
ncbi:sodium/potassium/calcium exchanger Nckx30C-like, partial [Pollicipes pollicipes]|uniref:sodium/potassium/calcium exchanger Nckx30C-like n=1 Tax=Pollicipes pollicipes TaxID=41117 RepID=UPI0018850B2A